MVSHRDGVCTAGPESGSRCCERFPEYDISMLTSKKDQDAGGGRSYRSREPIVQHYGGSFSKDIAQ
jgi:hypothetical protein